MKLNYLKVSALVLTTLMVLATSCSKDDVDNEAAQEVSSLPRDVLNKVRELDLNPEAFEVKHAVYPDGTKIPVVLTDDIAMEKSRFLKIPSDNNGLAKQYQTEFLIDTDVHEEVNIIVYTGPTIFDGDTPIVTGLSEAAQQGVRDAVENWNSVWGSRLVLRAEFTTATTFDPDFFETFIVVNSSLEGFGGFADFPDENGNPGNFVQISPNSSTFADRVPDAIEHLITHELGHAIGFRHTDWNSRQSCVDLGLEPEPSVEENPPARIFGTLPSIPGIIEQEDSIMNACFNADTTTGELNFFDENGLRSLYRGF
ncbi:M57 family metalloprotease [Aquimarina spongiae]|uniref:Dual-action HEIGH metallo-peptidase n=1 Tax=Aquimarina spongiae TaxID=570521 RepID=A0A1M6JH81_9FLAO|nr:M57 family metalloprotease [Aquimarina spongiae]SHJ45995.1 Dual-action HEIGH metallo-peptidase [Aquimarina spongiae]